MQAQHESDALAVSRLVGLSTAAVERALIVATLAAVGENRTRAAKVLGLSVRTLRNKLARYAAEGAVSSARGAPPPP